MDGEAWQVTVHGVARVRHDLATTSPPLCQGGSTMLIDRQRAALVIYSFSVSTHFVKLGSDER